MLEIDFQPCSPSSAKAVEYTCCPPSTVAAVGGIGNVHLVEQVLTSTRYCGVCACEFEFITCVKVYHCRARNLPRLCEIVWFIDYKVVAADSIVGKQTTDTVESKSDSKVFYGFQRSTDVVCGLSRATYLDTFQVKLRPSVVAATDSVGNSAF